MDHYDERNDESCMKDGIIFKAKNPYMNLAGTVTFSDVLMFKLGAFTLYVMFLIF